MFLECEQESLLFVIEMKSEQVQEQIKKLQQMDVLVEKNLSLEDHSIHILQQSEDLRVRIDNCQTPIHWTESSYLFLPDVPTVNLESIVLLFGFTPPSH
ncbi:coiled-coil domain-containing protein 69-like isoform X2 [Cynoglossus semilaevis]|uniref:coiled-coil domain-containing protein 69-like isoform X2 n=1 Tax=Cynoglossus semilaevis TaxID=244447 RepID=UPI000495DE8A|nr:coiled-coil domain-containing protein 69-like isoform X2 [Cynoglossus semilaevis]